MGDVGTLPRNLVIGKVLGRLPDSPPSLKSEQCPLHDGNNDRALLHRQVGSIDAPMFNSVVYSVFF